MVRLLLKKIKKSSSFNITDESQNNYKTQNQEKTKVNVLGFHHVNYRNRKGIYYKEK